MMAISETEKPPMKEFNKENSTGTKAVGNNEKNREDVT